MNGSGVKEGGEGRFGELPGVDSPVGSVLSALGAKTFEGPVHWASSRHKNTYANAQGKIAEYSQL